MQEASDFVSSTHDHLAASELSFDLYVESQQAKVSDEPIEDNLLLIKGLGSTRRWILKRAGIVTFAKLASADPEQVANLLGMGKYVSATQVRFWQAQAKKLRDGEDVQVWSYADWKIYQFELGRLVQYDRISDPKLRGERKRAIIAIFVKFDWVKYGNMSLFPDWLRRGIIRRSKS
jgi:predicted flap endonuclease-1-like 5' DNA nuclease